MSIKTYNKVFIGNKESSAVAQLKTWTFPTRQEKDEILGLILSGDYITVHCIVPRSVLEHHGETNK